MLTSPIVKAEGGVTPVIGYAAVYADSAKISGAAYADLLTAEQASFQSRTSERPKLFVPIFDHRAVTELSTRVAAQDARIAGLEASKTIRLHFTPERLDPITVYLDDLGPSKGRITVACYLQSWTAAWGGMAGRTVAEFVADCDAGYLHANLMPPLKLPQHQKEYLMRIVEAVRLEVIAYVKRAALEGSKPE